jgi:hypothetical protein
MYYIWSLIISIIIFGILQYIEYDKDRKEYVLLKPKNAILMFMIYLISTILCYFAFSDNMLAGINIMSGGGSSIDVENMVDKTQVDPSVLKRIPDNFNTGFEPFDDEYE